jgi:hypothetical protein
MLKSVLSGTFTFLESGQLEHPDERILCKYVEVVNQIKMTLNVLVCKKHYHYTGHGSPSCVSISESIPRWMRSVGEADGF